MRHMSRRTIYCPSVYESMKQLLLEYTYSSNVYNARLHDDSPSFVNMGQVFRDRTAIILKSKTTVIYPAQFVLSNFNLECRRYVNDHVHTSEGLLPVSTTVRDQNMTLKSE